MTAPDEARAGVLSIDAGQTGMKIRVRRGELVHETTLPGIRTNTLLLPQLADAARSALQSSGLEPAVLAAGVSGLTAAGADPAQLAGLLSDTPLRRVILAHDATTSFLGALGDARGAVIAAGTGVVTLAVGRDAVARVDGWGHTMGDAGSGFWIGREALVAVMRAFDGRGPATSLRAVVEQSWPELPDAYIQLQSDPDWVRRVASFAAPVAAAAAGGDAVAVAILHRAAAELAQSVHAGLIRVAAGDDPDARVCALGGVFRSPLLRDAFVSELDGLGVHAPLEEPRGEGIDGVEALSTLPGGHPLAALAWASG